jgi:hypothetical protein
MKARRGETVVDLPGFVFGGRLLCAFFRFRKMRKYFCFELSSIGLGIPPHRNIFEQALEQAGAGNGCELLNELWDAHRANFSPQAVFNPGSGWDYWFGDGVSESFVLALRDLVVARYAAARELYKSWEVPEDDSLLWGWKPPLPQIEHYEMYGSGRDDYED